MPVRGPAGQCPYQVQRAQAAQSLSGGGRLGGVDRRGVQGQQVDHALGRGVGEGLVEEACEVVRVGRVENEPARGFGEELLSWTGYHVRGPTEAAAELVAHP